MRKTLLMCLVAFALIMCAIPWVLLINFKYEFLPEKISNEINRYINDQDTTTSVDTSKYILLSTISDSPVLKKVDLLVPKETSIPSEEEIAQNYSGLYSDSIVLSLTNYDIIIQNYGIKIGENTSLNDFRNKIVNSLQKKCPNIFFESNRSIKKGNTTIPIIEFSTQNEDQITYSFIALIDVDGELITITVNSADPYLNAVQFFIALINNMLIK